MQKAEEYAKSINCVYLETSAKTGLHVRQAFVTLVHMVSYIYIYILCNLNNQLVLSLILCQ